MSNNFDTSKILVLSRTFQEFVYDNELEDAYCVEQPIVTFPMKRFNLVKKNVNVIKQLDIYEKKINDKTYMYIDFDCTSKAKTIGSHRFKVRIINPICVRKDLPITKFVGESIKNVTPMQIVVEDDVPILVVQSLTVGVGTTLYKLQTQPYDLINNDRNTFYTYFLKHKKVMADKTGTLEIVKIKNNMKKQRLMAYQQLDLFDPIELHKFVYYNNVPLSVTQKRGQKAFDDYVDTQYNKYCYQNALDF